MREREREGGREGGRKGGREGLRKERKRSKGPHVKNWPKRILLSFLGLCQSTVPENTRLHLILQTGSGGGFRGYGRSQSVGVGGAGGGATV